MHANDQEAANSPACVQDAPAAASNTGQVLGRQRAALATPRSAHCLRLPPSLVSSKGGPLGVRREERSAYLEGRHLLSLSTVLHQQHVTKHDTTDLER